jgi:glycosyltransferase involved in cell wall biosynthesis
MGHSVDFLYTTKNRLLDILKKDLTDYKRVYFFFCSFDFSAFYFCFLPKVVFVFHNVTPFYFFLISAPFVACRSLAASFQLLLLPRTLNWVAVSAYNLVVLKTLGFKNISLCPCIVSFKDGNTLEDKEGNPSLIYVGRIVENKRVLSLLETVGELSQYLDSRLSFTVVGSGKPRSKYLHSFRKKLSHVRSRYSKMDFKWIDHPITAEELSRRLAKSWIYVSLSQHEGFGLPVMEAISAGTPAIYCYCGGTESELNFLGAVDVDASYQPFISMCLSILLDPCTRNDLLCQQREVVNAYSLKALSSKIIEIYFQY